MAAGPRGDSRHINQTLLQKTDSMKTSTKNKVMKTAVGMITALALTFAASNASASRILGIDVSSFQGSINWSSVHADGVKFAFAKATEGTYYEDAYFNGNMNNGKAAGLQMGAYHFARPDTTCPSSQATYFWNFAGGKITADGKSIYPMVDFEHFNGHPCESSYTAWFNDYSTDLKGHTSHFIHPVIYASACSGMCDLTTACTLSQWVANYNGQNLYTGNPWSVCDCCNYVSPCTANNWTYWQVSSTGAISGISGNVDLDAYPLDLTALIANQGVK
jgi:lysozyme